MQRKEHVKDKKNVQRSTIQEMLDKLKDKTLESFSLKELLTPDGYAKKIAKEAKLTRVQLRKIYMEFKKIEDMKRRNKSSEEIRVEIYKLYPILQYQANRGLINKEFKNLMFKILDSLEKKPEDKNFEHTMEFVRALVAYTERES